MPLRDAAARLRSILKADRLDAALLANHKCGDLCAAYNGRTNLGSGCGAHKKDAIEGDLATWGSVEQLNMQLAAELHAILLPTCFDDCVHA